MSPTTIVRPDPYWLVAGALVVADQLVKLMISQTDAAFSVGRFSFGTVVNQEGAFGLPLSNSWLILIGSVICVILLGMLATGVERRPVRLGLWLIVAGALSNVLDRIFAGGAVDVIAIEGFTHFNLADVLIILGVFSIIRGIWWREPNPV